MLVLSLRGVRKMMENENLPLLMTVHHDTAPAQSYTILAQLAYTLPPKTITWLAVENRLSFGSGDTNLYSWLAFFRACHSLVFGGPEAQKRRQLMSKPNTSSWWFQPI